MPEPPSLVFGPYRLDVRDARLWRGSEPLPLAAKPLAVLVCLVTQAGQLVTKDALLAAVWPDTIVREDVLTVTIRTLRRVLGDAARTPHFIETVHGRGYRFMASVRTTPPPDRPALLERPRHPLPPTVSGPPHFVGRDAELAQLAQWWTAARQGQRQVGMIVGEPGIGKTALVETFVAQVCTMEGVWVGHGQCLDTYGAGDAYFPVLEALGRLGRGPEGTALVAVLRQYAPSWLVHLPALLPAEDSERLQPLVSSITPARMLRELTEALEVLTTAHPLLLVLEDLQWSDRATLGWLASVVRRRDPARLLVLGTYRPVDVIVHAPPLRALVTELRHHPQYAELVLDYLAPAATAAYLHQRCGAHPLLPGLPQLVHQRTSGHPLFLVAMVDELVRQGLLETAVDPGGSPGALTVLRGLIPTSLRQYIEQQLEHLSEADQALLDAASVAGSTFTVAAVAAGLGQAPEPLEARLTAFARHGQFLQSHGTEAWPDGTVTACYQFRHAVYHEVVYARVSAGQRMRLHLQIGTRKEAGYGVQAHEIAAELAVHFTQGHDPDRALRYLQQAAENARRRSALPDAITHLTTALALLRALPATPERPRQELAVQLALGPAFMATKGLAAPEVEQVYARARQLCQQVGETPQVVPALGGVAAFYQNRGALQTARDVGEELMRRAQRAATPTRRLDLLEAHVDLGLILAFLGDYAAARTHLEQRRALTDPRVRAALLQRGRIVVLGVGCVVYAAPTLWCLGHPAQALARSHEALALAQEVAHPHSLAMAHQFASYLQYFRRDVAAVQAEADALLTLATAQAFPLWQGMGTLWRGWALALQGQGDVGLVQLRQGLAAVVATGQELSRPFGLLLLAEALGHTGQVAEGLRVLADALTAFAASGRGDLLAEAYRLQGGLLLRQAVPDAAHAETCFHQALTVARRQQARSLELRAALSLSRLWQQQGKRHAAHTLLAPLYGWFTEGFDTADLQDARVLLEELGG